MQITLLFQNVPRIDPYLKLNIKKVSNKTEHLEHLEHFGTLYLLFYNHCRIIQYPFMHLIKTASRPLTGPTTWSPRAPSAPWRPICQRSRLERSPITTNPTYIYVGLRYPETGLPFNYRFFKETAFPSSFFAKGIKDSQAVEPMVPPREIIVK